MPEAEIKTPAGGATPPPAAGLKSIISDAVSIAAMGLLGVYVVLITFNAFMRYVFLAPQHWVPDVSELIVPIALGLTFPAAAMTGTNLSIQFLGNWLGTRSFLLLERIGRVFYVGILIVITWSMWDFAWEMHETGRTTVYYGIPLWPVWGGVFIGFLLSVPGAFFKPAGKPAASLD